MDSSALTLVGSLLLMVVAAVGAWRALDTQTTDRGLRKGLLVAVVFVAGFLALAVAIVLTARGGCSLLDCRGYLETQHTAKEAARAAETLPPPDVP
jgi:formate hydrogenlyase subunit 3/multisubunit Na+/H+ antiporter MnhD subunit